MLNTCKGYFLPKLFLETNVVMKLFRLVACLLDESNSVIPLGIH